MGVKRLTLDTPLLVLFVVGLTSPGFIARHKRLQGFGARDLDVLVELIAESDELVLVAHILTEASNWLGYTADPLKAWLFVGFQSLIRTKREYPVSSRTIAQRQEFRRLGLADGALLSLAEQGVIVLTTDDNLFAATLLAGYGAINFNHLSHRIRY